LFYSLYLLTLWQVDVMVRAPNWQSKVHHHRHHYRAPIRRHLTKLSSGLQLTYTQMIKRNNKTIGLEIRINSSTNACIKYWMLLPSIFPFGIQQ